MRVCGVVWQPFKSSEPGRKQYVNTLAKAIKSLPASERKKCMRYGMEKIGNTLAGVDPCLVLVVAHLVRVVSSSQLP